MARECCVAVRTGSGDTFQTLRADRFVSLLAAEFEPLAFHVSRALEVKHGLKFNAEFFWGDGEYHPDGESWAYGYICITAPNGKCSMIVATGVGDQSHLCSFEGDTVLFDEIVLADCLAEVAASLVSEAEKELGLLQ